MAIKLTDHAPEQGTYHIVCAFTDEDDAGNAPTALTWTLTNWDGVIINAREDESVATPATSNTITLAGTDLTIVAAQPNERLFLIEWTYDSSYGSGLTMSEEAVFIIDPRKAIA